MRLTPLGQSAINLHSIYDHAFDPADTCASVQTFRQLLHNIPDPSKRFEACVGMMNRLLDRYSTQRQHFELLFESIDTVMQEECPQYSEQKLLCSATHDTTNVDLQRCKRFIDVVEKGRDLRKQCFPPLNKTGNMWGDDKVRHYGWALTSYKFCKLLGQIAAKKSWEEAVTKLNQLIARRIPKGRVKDSANPIEQVDLLDLQAWDGGCRFTKAGTKGQELYSAEYATTSPGDLPKGYGLDRYGLVVRDGYCCTTSAESPPESPPESSPESSPLSSLISMSSLSRDTTPFDVLENAPLQSPTIRAPEQHTLPPDAMTLPSSEFPDHLSPGSGTAHTSHLVDPTRPSSSLQPEMRCGIRKSARAHAVMVNSHEDSTLSSGQTNTRKPRPDGAQNKQNCSCLRSVAGELLDAIARDSYRPSDADIIDEHGIQ